MSPAEWTAAGALLLAGLQLVLASRRDLGALTLSVAAAAVVLATPGTPVAAALLAGTALLLTLAWARASQHRTARPGLGAAALAVCLPGATHAWWAEALSPGIPLDKLQAVLLIPCALAASLGLVLALEQPPPSRRRHRAPYRKRSVPIEE